MNIKKYFGDKKFFKSTLIIAIPLMLQQVISTSVNLLDNLMIGQLGDHAIAGVASVNRFFMIAIFGTVGITAAASVFLAQFYGNKDEEHMKQSFRYALIASSFIMMVFIALAFIFPQQIIRFFVNDQKVLESGMQYIYVSALSFLPTMITIAITASMRAIGDSKKPLFASIISVFTNLILNYILIYGHFGFPQLGVLGAGIGTLIARIVELVIVLYFLKKVDYGFKTKISELFDISRTLIKAITLKALPLSINEIMFAMGLAMLMRFYGTRGADVISAYSITNTVADLFFTMNAGMAVATTILVSQPLGANKIQEARENGFHLLGFGIILSIVFGILLFMASFLIPHLYNVSPNAINLSQTFLRIMSVLFWIYVVNTSIYFLLRAGGDTRSTLILDSGYMWCVNLLFVGIATYYTNLPIIGLYLVGQSTDVVKMVIALKFIHKEKWLVNLAAKEKEEELQLEAILNEG